MIFEYSLKNYVYPYYRVEYFRGMIEMTSKNIVIENHEDDNGDCYVIRAGHSTIYADRDGQKLLSVYRTLVEFLSKSAQRVELVDDIGYLSFVRY